MHMPVHETRQDQIVAVIMALCTLREIRRLVSCLTGPHDMSAIDQDGAFFGIAHGIVINAGIAIEGKGSAGQQQTFRGYIGQR